MFFPHKQNTSFSKVLARKHIPALSVLYEYFFLENDTLSLCFTEILSLKSEIEYPRQRLKPGTWTEGAEGKF